MFTCILFRPPKGVSPSAWPSQLKYSVVVKVGCWSSLRSHCPAARSIRILSGGNLLSAWSTGIGVLGSPPVMTRSVAFQAFWSGSSVSLCSIPKSGSTYCILPRTRPSANNRRCFFGRLALRYFSILFRLSKFCLSCVKSNWMRSFISSVFRSTPRYLACFEALVTVSSTWTWNHGLCVLRINWVFAALRNTPFS